MSRPKLTLEDLFNLPGSEIFNPDSFSFSSYVSTDTRTIRKKSIFFALKGAKFDGHNFVDEAVAKGASAVVINRNRLKDFDHLDVTIVTVKDTTKSYGDLAAVYRDKLNAKVIGITGSNGKTSTKEMLAQLLSAKYNVHRTLANNNNHIGVPLTIFQADSSTDYLILEMGTNHFGEIAYTARIARPDYALITNIGSSHLEFLKDFEGVADEKIALFDVTAEKQGRLFYNGDNAILKRRAKKYQNKVSFGFKGTPDIHGVIAGYESDGRSRLNITAGDKNFEVLLPVHGESGAKNFLAAVSIALEVGLTPNVIKKSVFELTAVDKRLNVIKFNNFTVINDTYNANPESMKSAFSFISLLDGNKKKVAVLGDMFELGKLGPEAHRELAASIKKSRIKEVYTIGKLMKNLHNELLNGKITTKHFSNRNQLGKFLLEYNQADTVFLVKGSRGMKMEEFVSILSGKN